jgi:hypothetical protein
MAFTGRWDRTTSSTPQKEAPWLARGESKRPPIGATHANEISGQIPSAGKKKARILNVGPRPFLSSVLFPFSDIDADVDPNDEWHSR